ncbi:MAG: GNAT family N-acetyltransferase [Ignavibacteriales bacterium]|nr:GNAT family N-acetyltransferase [Ignavibacteriales bacterium]
MELQLKKSTLRPWQPGDEPSLVKHADNKKIWENVRDHFPHPYTMSDAERWVHHASQSLHDTVFAIVVNGEAVGSIGLVKKEDVYRKSMELGYWLGEQFWGRGIVTEAIGAVTQYGFSSFDIVRIYADVFEWNAASAHVLEKNGFLFEARLKKAICKNGRVGDVFMYAKTK